MNDDSTHCNLCVANIKDGCIQIIGSFPNPARKKSREDAVNSVVTYRFVYQNM